VLGRIGVLAAAIVLPRIDGGGHSGREVGALGTAGRKQKAIRSVVGLRPGGRVGLGVVGIGHVKRGRRACAGRRCRRWELSRAARTNRRGRCVGWADPGPMSAMGASDVLRRPRGGQTGSRRRRRAADDHKDRARLGGRCLCRRIWTAGEPRWLCPPSPCRHPPTTTRAGSFGRRAETVSSLLGMDAEFAQWMVFYSTSCVSSTIGTNCKVSVLLVSALCCLLPALDAIHESLFGNTELPCCWI
jgi:hypothetical protein